MVEKKNYHEIFIPFSDVYNLGGKNVFTEMEREEEGQKNLIILPFEFLNELEEINKKKPYSGASSVLPFVKELRRMPNEDILDYDFERRAPDEHKGFFQKLLSHSKTSHQPLEITKRTKHCGKLYHAMDGLDIALLQKGCLTNGSYKTLEHKILERWDITKKNSEGNTIRPEFITQNSVLSSYLDLQDVFVADPDMLLVDETIVSKGIIRGNDELQNALYAAEKRTVPLDDAVDLLDLDGSLYQNQFIRFRSNSIGSSREDYARVTKQVLGVGKNRKKVPVVSLLKEEEYGKGLSVRDHKIGKVFGVGPRDMDQYLALQYVLMNPDVTLGFVTGGHGSGKTLLSYIAALEMLSIYDDNYYQEKRGLPKNNLQIPLYERAVILKASDLLGNRDMGTLPGDLFQKILPHLKPYEDAHRVTNLTDVIAFEQMFHHPKRRNEYFTAPRSPKLIDKKSVNKQAHFSNRNELFFPEDSSYFRGRSFNNTYLIVDEAQNFTPYEIKTIIGRASEGSKIILSGDPAQVDNPDCSIQINGLTAAIQHFLPFDYSALVNLTKVYRAKMAEDALDLHAYGV